MRDKTPGRMFRQSIAEDPAFNSLSSGAKLLYLMLRPHFSAWGKMKADPHTLKGTVVPLNPDYNPHTIARFLEEISEKTPVKLFSVGGIPHLHDLSWDEHQPIQGGRRGEDILPSWPQAVPKCAAPGDLDENGYAVRQPLDSRSEGVAESCATGSQPPIEEPSCRGP